MLGRLLSASRYLTIVAVIGIFVLACLLLYLGSYKVYLAVDALLFKGLVYDKKYLLEFIEAADLYLLATVFYVTCIGLYELFVDSSVRLPEWLKIGSIDALKQKLISVVIVTLGVLFLGKALSWESGNDIMALGLAIGAVVLALSYFLEQKKGK